MTGKTRRNSNAEWDRGFDWKQFEQLFDEMFPNAIPGMRGESISKIGQFVSDLIDRTIPDRSPRNADNGSTKVNGLFEADISESPRFVRVRLRVPKYVDPRKVQLFVNGWMLKIEGPLGNKQIFSLPAPVATKSMHAEYRGQALYIRLRKRSGSGYREVYVHYP